jgi:hypothetical protein
MAIFNLKVDSLYRQWWRDYYEVEAETLEEAIQLILDEEVDAVDSELLIESISQIPLKMEIMDEQGEILYSKDNEEDK